MPDQNRRFRIGLVADHKATVREVKDVNFAELIQLVCRHTISPVKYGRGWTPAEFEPGPRTKERAGQWGVLVMDIEGRCEGAGTDKRLVGPAAPALDSVADEIALAGWSASLATSWSHEAPSPDGGTIGPRYRILVETSRSLTPGDEVESLARCVATMLGLRDVLDTAAMDPSRLFFFASAPADRISLARSRVVEGTSLDVDELLPTARLMFASEGSASPPKAGNTNSAGSVISAFNASYEIGALLEQRGYKRMGRNRWLSPHSSSGMAGIVLLDDGRLFCHHPNDLLHSAHTRDAFDVWTVLEHGGDQRTAVRAAARMLGISNRDEVRRAYQKRENAAIQEQSFNPMPLMLTPTEMLKRLVFVQDGSQVCLVESPRLAMALPDARNTFAASVVQVGDKGKIVPAINRWLSDPERLTVARRTFMPGSGAFCIGPEGHSAINTWLGFERLAVQDSAPAIQLFLEHVGYLFPDRAERETFLDWLAHIEQQPGVLPHSGWLHIAHHTGTGRNWLASVLARVWRGHVAPNVDLPSLLDGSFNGQLSECLLALVDEVQEGGDSGYRHINRLKSLVNAETRYINHKYGRAVLEKNCCRWLVFSNHENAIPMDDNDRRWRVIIHQALPRAARAYEALYNGLEDPQFIHAVAHFLQQRDISAFKPGERPPMSASKQIAVEASKSAGRRAADHLVDEWRSDVITSQDASRYLTDKVGRDQSGGMRWVMQEAGARVLRSADGKERKVRIGSGTHRVWVLRNHERWDSATPEELRDAVAVYGSAY
jgi:hypothetical protein